MVENNESIALIRTLIKILFFLFDDFVAELCHLLTKPLYLSQLHRLLRYLLQIDFVIRVILMWGYTLSIVII